MGTRAAVAVIALAACRPPPPEEQPPAPTAPPPAPVAPPEPEPACVGRPEVIDLGGNSPARGLAAADLSGDGKLDLLLLQDETRGKSFVSTLYVQLGDGAGGFHVGDHTAVGRLAVATHPADIDHDGQLDVVLVQYYEKKVAIVPGASGGALGPPKTFSVPRKPTSVAIDDLDGDGDLDLVVGSQTHLQAHLGDGAGGFKAKKAFAVGEAPTEPFLADADHDGTPDLYVPMNDSATFDLFRGTGKGGFESVVHAASCPSPTSPRAGDLDGDGTVDVVYACEARASHSCELPLVRGARVDTAYIDAAPTGQLVLGDFDGDAALDLVTFDTLSETLATHLYVHLGNGNGTFDPPLHARLEAQLMDPIAADVDGDGTLDVVAGYWTGHEPASLAVFTHLVATGDCQ